MLSRIRERKVVQWLIAYTVVAWAILQGIDLISEALEWSTTPLRVAVILALVGAPVVVVLGWYHGEKGRQRVTPAEAFILGALTLAGGLTLVAFGGLGGRASDEAAQPAVGASEEVDSARYAILPFEVDASVPIDPRADLRLHDALAHWTGIEVVDLFQVRDAVRSRPAARKVPVSSNARGVALRLGAGRFIRGEVAMVGGEVRFRAVLFETSTGRQLSDATVVLDPGGETPDSVFAGVAAALLFGDGGGSPDPHQPRATRSFPAYLAFLRGHEALQEWDLGLADSLFSVAAGVDPYFVRADLWRAQVRNWTGRHPNELGTLAERALAGGERLPLRERLLADALAKLARGDYREACQAYDELRKANERDFAAWYGLGECQGKDDVVVADASSPTGWRFRSSYHRALDAYERAFQLLPSVHRGFGSRTFETVDRLFFLSTERLRFGHVPMADPLRLVARPAWLGDTLVFVPEPAGAVAAGADRPWAQTTPTAVERQRERFNTIAVGWAEAFPESPEALQALALSQELMGGTEAIATLRAARSRASDEDQRLSIAVTEVIVQLKFGGAAGYAAAATLGDSILDAVRSGRAAEPAGLSVVAALLGRVHRASELARQSAESSRWLSIPPALVALSESLVAYAAFGGPVDSLVTYEERLEIGIRNRVADRHREEARHLLFDRAASLAYTSSPLEAAAALTTSTSYPLLEAQGAHASGDVGGAAQILGGIVAARSDFRPAQISLDAVFPECVLRLALGDTAAAVALLDSSLDALRWLEPGGLADVAGAASLVRAMALRAALADAAGEPEIARQWARAVSTLWEGADPVLAPILRRVQGILRGSVAAIPPLTTELSDGGAS